MEECTCLEAMINLIKWLLYFFQFCDCGTPWTFLLPFFLHTTPVVFVPCGDPRKSPRTYCQSLHFTITFHIPLPHNSIVLRVASGSRVKLASCKNALNTPVVYSTDRSKAVVPVLVLLFGALWFILRGDLLYVFPCVILFLCFSVLLVLRLPRLGKRQLILMLFVRLFDL